MTFWCSPVGSSSEIILRSLAINLHSNLNLLFLNHLLLIHFLMPTYFSHLFINPRAICLIFWLNCALICFPFSNIFSFGLKFFFLTLQILLIILFLLFSAVALSSLELLVFKTWPFFFLNLITVISLWLSPHSSQSSMYFAFHIWLSFQALGLIHDFCCAWSFLFDPWSKLPLLPLP